MPEGVVHGNVYGGLEEGSNLKKVSQVTRSFIRTRWRPLSRSTRLPGRWKTFVMVLVVRAPLSQLYVVSGKLPVVVSGSWCRMQWGHSIFAAYQLHTHPEQPTTPRPKLVLTRHEFTCWKFAHWHLCWGTGGFAVSPMDRGSRNVHATARGKGGACYRKIGTRAAALTGLVVP